MVFRNSNFDGYDQKEDFSKSAWKQDGFLNDSIGKGIEGYGKSVRKEVSDVSEAEGNLKKDDNGQVYREGDKLLPNITYEINGYTYQTDNLGRIVSAEGKLHIKEHDGRLTIADSMECVGKGYQREGDDRGHVIGDQLGGSSGMENLLPQDANLNRGDFKILENQLAYTVKEGKEVYYKVEPIYEGKSRRPEVYIVTYKIDNEENVRIFPNGRSQL